MKHLRTSLNQRATRTGLALLTAIALVTGIAWREGYAAADRVDSQPVTVAAAQTTVVPRSVAGGRDSYADVVKIVAPSVVTIRTEGRARMAPTGFPDGVPGFPGDFFGQFDPPSRGQQAQPRRVPRQRGLGSGVIVSNDGYVLTNHHVIDNADRILVDLTDGRTVPGRLVGSDEPSDLAVVKIDAGNIQSLALGDSEAMQVGDVVLAVGNPLGLGQTVTMGIISAKGRSTDARGYEEFLQTDAPINHGNSGGALVNTKGELVGINSQIASVSEGNIGIGFAIPTNMAKRVMSDLKSGGRVRRGQLGIEIQGVNSDLAESLGLKNVNGALVTGVTPGSAADRAGLKQEDVIVSFNGRTLPDTNALRNRVAETTPGASVSLGVIRDGKELTLTVKPDEKPAETSADNQSPAESNQDSLGISVAPLTPELAARADVPKDVQGLLIQSVNPDSRAAESGLRPGDVIQQANRQPVRSVEQLRTAVRSAGDRPVLLLVNREGRNVYVTVRPS